jgi:hypothetical protein
MKEKILIGLVLFFGFLWTLFYLWYAAKEEENE